MDISGKRMVENLKAIDYVRLSGTEGETKAANYIAEKIRELGAEPVIETFDVPFYTIEKVKLEALEPFYKEYEVTGYGFSGNNARDGIEAELKYLEGFDDLSLQNTEGKIVLFVGGINAGIFEKLIKAGAVGFIGVCGSYLDKKGTFDIEERMLREQQLVNGVIPGVCVHVNDAVAMVDKGVKRVRLTLSQNETTAKSRNVTTFIKGTTYPDEIVSITAHYDSVVFSHGMFDNGSGTVNNLEMLRYYLKNQPKRSLRFVFCGSEERGLYGSRAFVDQHPDEVKQTRLCCNVDMTGPVLGRDIVRITGEDKIVHAIDYYAKVNGHGATVYQDTYPSDGMPYALCGVPAVNFYRKAAEGTTNIHSRNDTLSRITAKSLESTGKFIVEVMNTIINAEVFPFDRKLPENMEQKTKTLLSNMPGYKDKDKESSNNQAKK